MQLSRMFSSEKYKGTKNYLNTQKKYELLRTILYFGVSLSLLAAGIIATENRNNVLTIAAILGCLPASKSAVAAVMYFRFKSLSTKAANDIEAHSEGLTVLYDMVFTSYNTNYFISHICIQGNTVCGYTEDDKHDEHKFQTHLSGILMADHHKNTTIKIFTDLKKYTERLEQMKNLEADETVTQGIVNTLKSVTL